MNKQLGKVRPGRSGWQRWMMIIIALAVTGALFVYEFRPQATADPMPSERTTQQILDDAESLRQRMREAARNQRKTIEDVQNAANGQVVDPEN